VSVDVNSDGTPRVATYSTPAPTGGWSWKTNGTYTISLGATQVCDTSSNYIAAGTLGTFTCAISGAPTVTYRAYHSPTGEPFDGDAANHTATIEYGGKLESPWSEPYELDAAGRPGWYAVDLTDAQAVQACLSLCVKSATENVRVDSVDNITGPLYVRPADTQAIDGSTTGATNLKADALSIIPGTVFDDAGTHAGSETVIYTTLPQRGTNGYKFQFATFGQDAAAGLRGVTRYILSSADVDTYTQLTFETALSAAPADDVTLIVQGNAEAKV
jgi:hypothetical protein